MNYKSYITAAMLGAALIAAPGCQDEFAKTNTNPSAITKADVRYLFTKALAEFEPSKYQQWFYNNMAYMMPWSQAVLSSETGNLSSMNLMGAFEGSERQVINVKLYTEEILFVLSQMSEEEASTYENIRVMCNPLLVYLGIFGSDMYGSLAYSEAAKGLHEMILTPKYETQEELFDKWLEQLDETINVLNSNLPNQVKLEAQDFVYQGDVSKWMKFANSLKLKIAVRLLHVNKAKALSIAEDVMKSPAGIIDNLAEDFFYCKGAQQYHWGDDVFDGQGRGIGSETLINFLVEHEDPRVRFVFQKNDFNCRVVQAFIDNKVELPKYIKDVAVIENGKFVKWAGKGEPWVRYFGAPVSTEAVNTEEGQKQYFNYNNFKIGAKQYYPLARMNREMLQGQKDYTFPDAPNVPASQDIQDNAWYGLHFSAAEVNLYLAELKLLGANIPGTAEEYLKKGITFSIQEYNELARLNKIPYYDKPYVEDLKNPDLTEATLQLKDGEIDKVLSSVDYQLSGNLREQLEKVYIQQYIHFLLFPQEQFVQVRRSGVPMRDSKILPWVNFTNNDANFSIPRRWTINTPLESDQMYQIKVDAFKAQGYTTGTQDPATLNKERVWYDKGAPNFGEGPNF